MELHKHLWTKFGAVLVCETCFKEPEAGVNVTLEDFAPTVFGEVTRKKDSKNGLFKFWCKWCAKFHTHGWLEADNEERVQDGHRNAHCGETSPYNATGYCLSLLQPSYPGHAGCAVRAVCDSCDFDFTGTEAKGGYFAFNMIFGTCCAVKGRRLIKEARGMGKPNAAAHKGQKTTDFAFEVRNELVPANYVCDCGESGLPKVLKP